MDDSVKPIAGGVGGAVVVGVAADRLKLSGQSASALVSGTQLIISTVVAARQSKKRSPAERLEQIVRPQYSWPPILVAFFVFATMQLIINLVGFVLGATIGLAFSIAETDANDQQVAEAAVASASIIVVCVTTVTTVFIAKRASYYIARHALLWIGAALLLSGIVNVVLNSLFLDLSIKELVAGQILGFFLLLGASAIGYRRARKTYRKFIMVQGFRRLMPDQQETLNSELKKLLAATEIQNSAVPAGSHSSTTDSSE
jgi:hypothetical protein